LILDPQREGLRTGEGLFTWVATASRSGAFGKNVCDGPAVALTNGHVAYGCVGRHLQTQSMNDWLQDGMPGAASTHCDHNCHCVLVSADIFRIGPEEGFEPPVEPIQLEQIAATIPAASEPVSPARETPPDWLAQIHALDDVPAALRIMELARRNGISEGVLLTKAREVAGRKALGVNHLRQALGELVGTEAASG